MTKRKRKKKSGNNKASLAKQENQETNKRGRNKAPLSLCMIVKNEERFLFDCLKSINDLVSEIIIVDTGSTDKTVQIARRFSAKVYSYQWQNDFAKARNFALQQASQPWILYLDADERLHPIYHEAIGKAVSTDKFDAYYIRVRSEVGSVLGDIPHIQAYPRLFRNKPAFRFEGRIHEQITPSIRRQHGRFSLLDAEIAHLGYNLSEQEMKAKINRNLQSLQKQVEDEPQNAYAKFQLGQTFILAKDDEKGEQHLREAIDSGKLNESIKASALLILANQRYLDKNYQEAIHLTQQATGIAPRQRVGWFLQSECFAKLEQFENALASLKKMREHKNLAFSDVSVDKLFDEALVSQREGLYYFSLNVYSEAIRHLAQYLMQSRQLRIGILEKFLYALLEMNHSLSQTNKIFHHLLENLTAFDDVHTAIRLLGSFFEQNQVWQFKVELFRRACELYPQEARYYYWLGNIFLEKNHFDEAEKYYKIALQHSQSTYEIHYNLAVVAIKRRDYKKAILALENIKTLFPQNREAANRLLGGLYMKVGDVEQAQHYALNILEAKKKRQLTANRHRSKGSAQEKVF